MGVFKKKNRWYAEFYVDGKRKCEVVKVEGTAPELVNRKDALDFLAIKRSQAARGEFMSRKEKALAFEKLARAYLEWASENHRSPDRDRAAVKALLSHFEGKNVHALSLFDVEKYKSARKKLGRKPETINKELGVLRRMLNLAVGGALDLKVSKNPLAGLKLVKVPERKHRVLKDWEFQKLYAAATGHFKPILLCAYVTGMRRGEIARLKWSEVDLHDRRIHVIETKNDESRSIPIADSLYQTLSNMKARADEARKKAQAGRVEDILSGRDADRRDLRAVEAEQLRRLSASEYVFTGSTGKPYVSPTGWKRSWSTALAKAGIDKCRFHDLRHTFVSNLIVGEKEDFATVMSLSGHKDIKMLKRYSHTREEAKVEAINKLGKRLEPPTSTPTSYSQEPEADKVIDITKRNS